MATTTRHLGSRAHCHRLHRLGSPVYGSCQDLEQIALRTKRETITLNLERRQDAARGASRVVRASISTVHQDESGRPNRRLPTAFSLRGSTPTVNRHAIRTTSQAQTTSPEHFIDTRLHHMQSSGYFDTASPSGQISEAYPTGRGENTHQRCKSRWRVRDCAIGRCRW